MCFNAWLFRLFAFHKMALLLLVIYDISIAIAGHVLFFLPVVYCKEDSSSPVQGLLSLINILKALYALIANFLSLGKLLRLQH